MLYICIEPMHAWYLRVSFFSQDSILYYCYGKENFAYVPDDCDADARDLFLQTDMGCCYHLSVKHRMGLSSEAPLRSGDESR